MVHFKNSAVLTNSDYLGFEAQWGVPWPRILGPRWLLWSSLFWQPSQFFMRLMFGKTRLFSAGFIDVTHHAGVEHESASFALAISSRDQRQRNLRVGRSSERTALLLFPSVFLTKLRDLFVLICDLSHYGLGFGDICLTGDSTCFLGSETPKLWIVRSAGHLFDPNCTAPLFLYLLANYEVAI